MLYCAKKYFRQLAQGAGLPPFIWGFPYIVSTENCLPKKEDELVLFYTLPPGADRLLNKLNWFLLVYYVQCQLPEKLLIVYAFKKGLPGGIDYVIISFSEVKISCFYYVSDDQAVSLILLRVASL